MAQGMNRDQAGARPNGMRGERSGETRFRGDMDRDRNDGGFLPVDREDDYRTMREREMDLEYRNRDWSRRDAGGESQRWGEGRTRWNEGRERGAEFGRDRYRGERDIDRGVEPGNWERPFERHPGEYQSVPLRDRVDAQRAERHPRDQHREYHEWREEQVRRMDDEYDQYRRHRQTEFNTHFDQWRKDKLSGADSARGAYVGQNDKIGATPVEFGGQNATNSGFTRKDDEGRK